MVPFAFQTVVGFFWAMMIGLWLAKYSSITYAISFGLHGIMRSSELIIPKISNTRS